MKLARMQSGLRMIMQKHRKEALMKGKWKVSSNFIGDEKMYSVYRLRDVDKIDHSGNREYAGDWTENREAAQVLADQLNNSGRRNLYESIN